MLRVQTPPLPEEVLRARIAKALADNADVLVDLRSSMDGWLQIETRRLEMDRRLTWALAALCALQTVTIGVIIFFQ